MELSQYHYKLPQETRVSGSFSNLVNVNKCEAPILVRHKISLSLILRLRNCYLRNCLLKMHKITIYCVLDVVFVYSPVNKYDLSPKLLNRFRLNFLLGFTLGVFEQFKFWFLPVQCNSRLKNACCSKVHRIGK
jgi:hypothetical protein